MASGLYGVQFSLASLMFNERWENQKPKTVFDFYWQTLCISVFEKVYGRTVKRCEVTWIDGAQLGKLSHNIWLRVIFRVTPNAIWTKCIHLLEAFYFIFIWAIR